MNTKISLGIGGNALGISLNSPHSSIFKPKCILLHLMTFWILTTNRLQDL